MEQTPPFPPKKIWSTKKIFGIPKKILVYQKEIWSTKNSQRLTKNSLRLDNFFWSTQKNEKKTGQLVDHQETDQNHMDGTSNFSSKTKVTLKQAKEKWKQSGLAIIVKKIFQLKKC